MVLEAVRYAAGQAAGQPGVASVLDKDSFLTPLLAGVAAPARWQECEWATMFLCHACPNSFSYTTTLKSRMYAAASAAYEATY